MAPIPTKKPAKQRRYYEHNGKRLSGVTSIIGKHLGWKVDALIQWAHKQGKEGKSLGERDEAAKLGQACHAIVESELKGEPIDYEGESFKPAHVEKARPNAARILDKIRERRWRVLAVEEAISAESFGGTIDLVVEDPDKGVMIADIKTGKGVYPEMKVQLGAYAWLWRIRCARKSDFGIATCAEIIHAPFGEALTTPAVGPRALATGEQIFRKLLEIEECHHMLEDESP